jgi:hypothetical protein
MQDHGISLNTHCPCKQPQCPIFGNCVLCIQNHLEHKNHLPECVQEILRPAVLGLCQQMELATTDKRPAPEFWKTCDREQVVKNSKARHAGK